MDEQLGELQRELSAECLSLNLNEGSSKYGSSFGSEDEGDEAENGEGNNEDEKRGRKKKEDMNNSTEREEETPAILGSSKRKEDSDVSLTIL